MPRRDGTGPQGQGNGTGRGMGACKSNTNSNPENQTKSNNQFAKGKGYKRIAIPTENGILCSHFGHCEAFYIADIEDNKIVNSSFVTPPAHEPGLYPAWIKEQGVNEVICGGMGEKAKELFAQQNISLYIGVDTKKPEELVYDLLNNRLKMGQNSCNH